MHPLKGVLSIDVDDQISLGSLGGLRYDDRPVTCAFFDPRDPRVTPAFADAWRSFGRRFGLRYVPHSWDPGLSAKDAAKKVSDYIAALEADGKRRVDAVEYDTETHDVTWQHDYLIGADGTTDKGIRGRGGKLPDPHDPATLGWRWGRPGVYTFEGRQSTQTVEAPLAASCGLLVGPQCYDGDMTELWSWQYELRTWVLNANPDRPGATIPLELMIPYADARPHGATVPNWARYIPGDVEAVLFASSRAQA
jgi:hypothetical protein